MNLLNEIPSRLSIIFSSSRAPNVVTASACVSPRVNSAEPWVLGKTFVSHVIGLISSGLRPSIRIFSLINRERISSFLISEKI